MIFYFYVCLPLSVTFSFYNLFVSSCGIFFFTFNICCKTGLLVLILLSFACMEHFWFLHQNWTSACLGRVFLAVFPFHHFKYIMPLLAYTVTIGKSSWESYGDSSVCLKKAVLNSCVGYMISAMLVPQTLKLLKMCQSVGHDSQRKTRLLLMLEATEDMLIMLPDFWASICQNKTKIEKTPKTCYSAG